MTKLRPSAAVRKSSHDDDLANTGEEFSAAAEASVSV